MRFTDEGIQVYPYLQKNLKYNTTAWNIECIRQFTVNIASIFPKQTTRDQIQMASTCCGTVNLWSSFGQVILVSTCIDLALLEDEITNNNNLGQKEPTAVSDHSLSDAPDNNLSGAVPVPECESIILSTILAMRKVIEEQQEILNHTILQNTELLMQNAELMKVNWAFCRTSVWSEYWIWKYLVWLIQISTAVE